MYCWFWSLCCPRWMLWWGGWRYLSNSESRALFLILSTHRQAIPMDMTSALLRREDVLTHAGVYVFIYHWNYIQDGTEGYACQHSKETVIKWAIMLETHDKNMHCCPTVTTNQRLIIDFGLCYKTMFKMFPSLTLIPYFTHIHLQCIIIFVKCTLGNVIYVGMLGCNISYCSQYKYNVGT